MRTANSISGEKTYISKAIKGEKYFCPFCNDEMIVKKGKIIAWHFAHKHAQCGKSKEYEEIEKLADNTPTHYNSTLSNNAETILDIWERCKPDVVIVKNIVSGRLFRIHDDPSYTIEKYHGNVYGFMSDKNGVFHKESESLSIYGWDKPQWNLIWYVKTK